MKDLLLACQQEERELVRLARALVEIESPSRDVEALERCGGFFAGALTSAGASVTRSSGGRTAADHIVAEWPGAGPRVMLIGHFDTVWPRGQLARQPLEERDGKLFGPGVYDMKGGLAIALTAMRVLTARVPADRRPHVTFLATSDEEVGSGTSRPLIERLARGMNAVLVFEPAIPNGAVKTSRKGVGEFHVTVTGVSSHAGADPGAGASAVHELARQIMAIQGLADASRGLTVNVGVIEGGTRSNVVAETARAVVDVRVSRKEDGARIEQQMRSLRAVDPRVTVTVTGGVNRPPMERTEGVARLFAVARDIAAEIGWELREGATGGASDGNFTAALGVPTLDGLGAVGDGAHALHEHVVIKELPRRTALLAGLLVRLGDNGIQELSAG